MPDFVLLLPHLITATIIVTASALVTYLLCRWRERQQDRGHTSLFSDGESFETQQQISRLSSEIAEFKQRDTQALTTIQDLEQEITATDKRQQETVQELARAKRSLANTTATLETAKHERDQLAQEMQPLQEERDQLAQQALALQKERDQLAQQAKALYKERDQLAHEALALQKERDQLTHEALALQEERENAIKLDESNADSDEKILELTEALRESEYQVSRLGTEIQLLRTVRTEFEAIRSDNRDLEEDLERLRSDNQAMETHVNRLTADANSEREQRLEADRELTQCKATMASLQEALAAAKKAPPQPALPTPATVRQGQDRLTEIEGIPPGLENKLNEIGITHWAQIAAWTEKEVRHYSDQLGFEGRIQRDLWVEKAQALCGTSKPSLDAPANDPTSPDNEDEDEDEDVDEDEDEDVDVDVNVNVNVDVDVDVDVDEDEDELEQFSLFALAPVEDPPVPTPQPPTPAPQPSGPLTEETSSSSDDDSLIINDPTLGKVYRRPPSTIDDLTRIKGIARVIEGRLHEIGIFRYQQIAEWSDRNVEAFSKRLTFKDRIQRDQWISQCQELHQEKYGDS